MRAALELFEHVVGLQLYKSLELREMTANAKSLIANPHPGKFCVEVSR